jgi:hypothetical protein
VQGKNFPRDKNEEQRCRKPRLDESHFRSLAQGNDDQLSPVVAARFSFPGQRTPTHSKGDGRSPRIETPRKAVIKGNSPVSGTATEAFAPLSSDKKRNQDPNPLRNPLSTPTNSRYLLSSDSCEYCRNGMRTRNPTTTQMSTERDEIWFVPSFCSNPTAPQHTTVTKEYKNQLFVPNVFIARKWRSPPTIELPQRLAHDLDARVRR